MAFTYTESVFADPPEDCLAEGLQDLIVGNSLIFTEISAERDIDLPTIGADQIFVGNVNKDSPKLLVISPESISTPETGTQLESVALRCVLRSGKEGTPSLQLNRSAAYTRAIRRLVVAVSRFPIESNGLHPLLLSWPAQADGESAGDYLKRQRKYHKQIDIELVSIQSLPSNEAARSADGGYEGGLLITYNLRSGVRKKNIS